MSAKPYIQYLRVRYQQQPPISQVSLGQRLLIARSFVLPSSVRLIRCSKVIIKFYIFSCSSTYLPCAWEMCVALFQYLLFTLLLCVFCAMRLCSCEGASCRRRLLHSPPFKRSTQYIAAPKPKSGHGPRWVRRNQNRKAKKKDCDSGI